MTHHQQAPELVVDRWFNTTETLSLESFRGRVVAIEAFQMLCPGCVAHGIPQARRIGECFPHSDVVVLGLHTVFEHHAAMGPVSLEAFLHEYRVSFPVAVDQPTDTGIPETMRRYRMQGTPTLLLIDAAGRLRRQWFGRVDDLVVGGELMRLVQEKHAATDPAAFPFGERDQSGGCDTGACPVKTG